MLTQVSDIAVTLAPSVLEAALLENETIKALNPPYNVQLRSGDPRVWYSDQDFASAAAQPSDQHRLGPLSSEYALRPLWALTELLAGAAPTRPVRAHAVGVSALWTPDEEVFAAGWDLLRARHAEVLGPADEPPRCRALRFARALLANSAGTDARDVEAGDTADETAWDPERVARHLERAAAQAYRAYRRTRWLRVLDGCDISYREPEAATARTLRVRAGEIALPSELGWSATAVPEPASFDRARYDRLRILTTELKRILRDGGDVCVTTQAGRRLEARRLRGIFAVV
jgi:hypothetical protein